ncbi:hypothetical protein SAMN05660742_113107 [Propionispira arboris]|uniref:Damage-control phosphatase ARMT1-like metal-binding domain-containing protein n=1 Tax=Propionispira arboris TaxID=84035 RepID=A0A1H7B0H8_9FIRM|nr:ARMT1-like domain-containing protein [Propionispira arboris]SEJ67872.1 hypothetical protein SAMN05660742_113107 [Propionispira arboris]
MINFPCFICLQKQSLDTMKRLKIEDSIQEKTLRKIMELLLNIDWSLSSDELENEVNIVFRGEIGNADPFKQIKDINNKESMKLIEAIKEKIKQTDADKKIAKATLAAIAGNIIDFGPDKNFNVGKTLQKFLKKKRLPRDFNYLREELLTANTILYFLDNAGEIVFDKLLLETINSLRNKPFSRISLVVKGGPFVNDVTLTEALSIGMNEIPNVEFRKIGNGEPDTGPNRKSAIVEKWIKEHDIVLSKGQANYAGLHSYKNIYFLLIAKCAYSASVLNVPEGSLIIKRSI